MRRPTAALLIGALALPASGCVPAPAERREKEMVDQCEHFLLTFKVKSPASYKRIDLTVGIPDEKKHIQTVFIQYDAVNEYNAPMRELQQCDFPYGPEEARIRPVSDFERNAVAETDRDHPEIDSDLDVPSAPDCCMPASNAQGE